MTLSAAARRDRIETLQGWCNGGGILTILASGIALYHNSREPGVTGLLGIQVAFLLAGALLLWLGRTLPELIEEASPAPLAILALILLLRLGATGYYLTLGLRQSQVLLISFLATTYLFYMMASIRRLMVDQGGADGRS